MSYRNRSEKVRAMTERTKHRKAISRARLLALVVLAAICCAYAGAARASELQSGSTSLGSGSGTVTGCQSTPLSVGFVPVYDPKLGTYGVGSVLIQGLNTAPGRCGSKPYSLTLGGGPADAALAEVEGTTPSTGDRLSVDVAAHHVSAAAVSAVHLVITG
jgi:hypothetical protein